MHLFVIFGENTLATARRICIYVQRCVVWCLEAKSNYPVVVEKCTCFFQLLLCVINFINVHGGEVLIKLDIFVSPVCVLMENSVCQLLKFILK